ncbi:hypothetical protein AGROH133_14607 (plasmid) [Agrobacterium tumefaciens]|nr:hypothetical protein AGROH133_14607 [Agrobacterium tumefaciens]
MPVGQDISSGYFRNRQHVSLKLIQALLSQIHDPRSRARRGSWQIGDYEKIAGPRGRNYHNRSRCLASRNSSSLRATAKSGGSMPPPIQ